MGIVEAIHTTSEHDGEVAPVDSAVAEPNRGLVGDRYADPDPEYTGWDFSTITLIEAEAVEGVGLNPGESRRNITVRGIALNPLVGQRFTVGGVVCEGVELCHPCAGLEKRLERPGLVKQLVERGGLRARVIEGGEIRVGDAVTAP